MIINSLLDTDLYKLTMLMFVYHQFPGIEVEYKFKCRNKKIPEKYLDRIADEINHLCTLKFTDDELNYLSTLPFFKDDFIDFLRLFQFNINHIEPYFDHKKEELCITIKGPWLLTILFEVPVLAIVNEVYFEDKCKVGFESNERLAAKIEKIINGADYDFRFVDFGTRRRFNKSWHSTVIQELKTHLPDNFVGTSNVMFAKMYNIKPIGTISHELLQAGQAVGPRLIDSQKYILQKWVDEYRGDLGIALTDVIGIDAFLKDFDIYFAKLYDGLRHDSGDPYKWGDKVINHYDDLGIESITKTAVFSDGLTIDSAINLYNYFKNRIGVSFGIGTHLTNDVGIKPVQIVIKMTTCNGQPVAKISDSPGKTMCEDEDYVKYLKQVFGLKE